MSINIGSIFCSYLMKILAGHVGQVGGRRWEGEREKFSCSSITAARIISTLFSIFGSSSLIKGFFILLGQTEILGPSSTAFSALQGSTTTTSEEEDLYSANDFSRVS